jgi:hypothetical protein
MRSPFLRGIATYKQPRFIHLSGRDLADKLARGMAEIHASRIAAMGEVLA